MCCFNTLPLKQRFKIRQQLKQQIKIILEAVLSLYKHASGIFYYNIVGLFMISRRIVILIDLVRLTFFAVQTRKRLRSQQNCAKNNTDTLYSSHREFREIIKTTLY